MRRANRCGTSQRQVAVTNLFVRHVKIIVAATLRILPLRSVAQIQVGLNSCDINKREQPCRSSSADEANFRRDVSQRFVAWCVSALGTTKSLLTCNKYAEHSPISVVEAGPATLMGYQ